ncbi:MAG: hypothetical protein J6A01_05250 [Proteobacteria bacterium]|nr:hypothetical protein [Pseudomonadota bacterium]
MTKLSARICLLEIVTACTGFDMQVKKRHLRRRYFSSQSPFYSFIRIVKNEHDRSPEDFSGKPNDTETLSNSPMIFSECERTHKGKNLELGRIAPK